MTARISTAQATALGVQPKRNKYGNKPSNGYASKKEERRALELRVLASQGIIRDLREQVTYNFTINGVKICAYRCDFQYVAGDKLVVEDVKSPATAALDVFRIKRKPMKALYGIDVRIV